MISVLDPQAAGIRAIPPRPTSDFQALAAAKDLPAKFVLDAIVRGFAYRFWKFPAKRPLAGRAVSHPWRSDRRFDYWEVRPLPRELSSLTRFFHAFWTDYKRDPFTEKLVDRFRTSLQSLGYHFFEWSLYEPRQKTFPRRINPRICTSFSSATDSSEPMVSSTKWEFSGTESSVTYPSKSCSLVTESLLPRSEGSNRHPTNATKRTLQLRRLVPREQNRTFHRVHLRRLPGKVAMTTLGGVPIKVIIPLGLRRKKGASKKAPDFVWPLPPFECPLALAGPKPPHCS